MRKPDGVELQGGYATRRRSALAAAAVEPLEPTAASTAPAAEGAAAAPYRPAPTARRPALSSTTAVGVRRKSALPRSAAKLSGLGILDDSDDELTPPPDSPTKATPDTPIEATTATAAVAA